RHVPRPFDHDLTVVLPGNLRELAQGLELRYLRLVVGVVDRSRPEAVAERKRNVVSLHDLADVLEVRVQETLLMMRQAPLGHDRAAPRYDARHPLGGEWDEWQTHSGMDGEVVDALLGLLDQGVAE